MDKLVDAPDEQRAMLRASWAAVAPAWKEKAERVDERSVAATARLLEVTGVSPGDRVLELGCGPGGLGLAAAERVGPDGEVILSDVVPEMVAAAAERAAARGLHNVRSITLDLERVDQPDDAYDVVLARESLHLVPDPARGLTEMRRVAKPGGRVGVAVWGPRDRNPWLGVLFDVISEHIGHPVPPPGTPHPFALEDAGRLKALMQGAGLREVAVEEVPTPLRAASLSQWWPWVSALAGPLAKLLAALPEEVVAAMRDTAFARLRQYETSDGLEIPGVSLVAHGRA